MEKKILPNDLLLSQLADILAQGKDVKLSVKGNSMLPFIRDEIDSVLLRKVDELKVGDIVLAATPERHWLLHRIWEIQGDAFILMGDGNLSQYEMVFRPNIAGKVLKIIRGNSNKTIDCDSESHQRKARLWRRLLPYRGYILKIYKIHYGLVDDGYWKTAIRFLKQKLIK